MRSLAIHISISYNGVVSDVTGHSLVPALGQDPEIRLHGECDLLVFALNTESARIPLYLMGAAAGYVVPDTSHRYGRSWKAMHPESIKYNHPDGVKSENSYIYTPPAEWDLGEAARDRYATYYTNSILTRYISGCIYSGGVPYGYSTPRQQTQRAAQIWQRIHVCPYRGLMCLASNFLVVAVGDVSLIETSGLGQGGEIDIAELLDLRAALASLSVEEMVNYDATVKAHSRIDISKLKKALKPPCLLVKYRAERTLGEAALTSGVISAAHSEDPLL